MIRLKIVLDKIKEKIPEFEKVKEKSGDNSWEAHYNCPIHVLLTEAGKPVHFG